VPAQVLQLAFLSLLASLSLDQPAPKRMLTVAIQFGHHEDPPQHGCVECPAFAHLRARTLCPDVIRWWRPFDRDRHYLFTSQE
jgi:hypothetical protein